MKDGLITGNAVAENGYGGGVASSDIFTMDGGCITHNYAHEGGGVNSIGTFTMNDGNISENESNKGGGIYNWQGTLNLEGGDIKGNFASSIGGGVHNEYGIFKMNGGNISQNTSSLFGGGVCNLGDFTMTSGTVSENISELGGGLYSGDSFFTIKGGKFSGNMMVEKNSNGVYVKSSGIIYGGTVEDEILIDNVFHSMTFEPNYGTAKNIVQYAPSGKSVKMHENSFKRSGFSFINWNTEADGSGQSYPDCDEITLENDIRLYAQWKNPEKTPYKVEHYKQKLDGTYTKKASETETFIGKANTRIEPEVKTYKGFTSPEPKRVKIKEDGTTVVKYYYTRNSYTLTWDFSGGKAEGEYTKGSVKYGAPITIPEPSRKGYVFKGWNIEVPAKMPANNLTVKAVWKYATDTPYKVEHYRQKLDGTYPASANETETFKGKTNSNVTPEVKTYKGFTAPATQTLKIKADGSLTVKYYYTRNTYKLTWDFAGGSASGRYTKGNVKYGATIIVPTPVRDGYKFNGWDKVVSAKMPASDVTYKAKWRKLSQEEKVKKFVERFYTTILDRPAEAAGLNDWTNRLISKQATGADVAAGFINSGEFQKKKMNDEEYVTRLYRAFFDREPDQEGYNNWLRELKNGKTRDDVLRGFINSPEFNNLCKKYGINTGSY